MKKILLLLLLSISVLSIAQNEFKKNSITVETGFFDRGLFGFTYQRNFEYTTALSTSLGIGAGVGADIDFGSWGLPELEPNAHFYTNAMILLGNTSLKVALGIQPKITLREHNTFFFERSTASLATYIGLSFINSKGLVFQPRVGIAPHFKLNGLAFNRLIPSLGISIGKAF